MTHNKPEHNRGKAERIRGITRDAALLGVCRVHLWEVLTGRRKSAKLSNDYHALKAAQAAGASVKPQPRRHKRPAKVKLLCAVCRTKLLSTHCNNPKQ